MIKLKNRTIHRNGKIWFDHHVLSESRLHIKSLLETNNITSLLNTRKSIAINHQIKPTNESKFPIDFLLSRLEYVGILCSKLFPSDDGIIKRISSNDNAKAQYHTYSYHAEVGKNRPKNIRTISVWNELKKYENQYFRFSLKIFLINFKSISILNGNKFFVLKWTSTFCHIELATTENITQQNAKIVVVLTTSFSNETFLKIRYTVGSKTANCDNLATIKDRLSLFIFQNNCNGSCWIHTNILLAEYSIASGNHRIMNGLLVYAGIRYAVTIAIV